MKKPLYNVGDLVLYNGAGEFGNEQDYLFHIHSLRYGVCSGVSQKQYWYAGHLLKIGEHASKGIPQVLFLQEKTPPHPSMKVWTFTN